MMIRRNKILAAGAVALCGVCYVLYSAIAQDVSPVPQLAQAPLNTSKTIKPAFIMAMDDSRSMVYQAVFPTRDTQGISGGGGGACWSGDSDTSTHDSWGFFSGPGQMRLDLVGGYRGRGTCEYFYYMTGVRDLNNYGVPPIDAFGFSRSHVYSYSYYNPNEVYMPWSRGDGTNYPDSPPASARIEPHGTTTVNLTTEVEDRNDRSRFSIYRGMRLPAGLKYYGSPGCGLTDQNSSSSSPRNWRVLDDDVVANCGTRVNAYISYFPATFYLPENHPAPSGFHEGNRVLAQNACSYAGATGDDRCDMYRYEIRPENYEGGEGGDFYQQAIKNFANWFTYYGNRQRAAIAAASHALADVNNMRVGYFTISNRIDVSMYDMADTGDRAALYGIGSSAPGTRPSSRPGSSTLLGLPADASSTPNTSAVYHLGEQFKRRSATGGAPIQLACQKNAGMLFTDGFNNDNSLPSASNAPAITGLGAPFDNTPARSMAAIASKYYFNSGSNTVGDPGTSPLRGTTGQYGFDSHQVPVPQACRTLTTGSMEWKRLDCQTNLHMNLYAITLGVSGNLFDADADPRQDPFDPPIVWPNERPSNNSAGTVDDLWHATVNTRGEFINANTPDQITAAMRRILAAIGDGSSPSGTIALTGARIGAGSLTVEPSYTAISPVPDVVPPMDWFGDVAIRAVTADPLTGAVTESDPVRVSEALPSHSARNIRFGRTTGSVSPTVAAFSGAPTALSLAGLCVDETRCDAAFHSLGGLTLGRAVNYLRGDRSLEGSLLRERTHVLGDIVNSSPVVVAKNDDYGYRAYAGGIGSSYADYLAQKAASTQPPMVYVGANDGMFHAFRGDTGAETFAYIPAAVVGHLGNLLIPYDPELEGDQPFRHQYYVDGPVTVSDVCSASCTSSSDWRTVLVGTSGAGGRSVFAMDITNPSSISVLWEVNDLVSDANVSDRIGHVLAKPVIVPVRGAGGSVSWKAIFGNGYNSADQEAVLFVVDALTGDVQMITASENDPSLNFNGLGAVAAIDRTRPDPDGSGNSVYGADGYADTVYAADQNGAIWKFDLTSAATAFGNQPLFVARAGDSADSPRQTITGGLEVAAGPGSAVMVYFGSGSFVFESDSESGGQETLYAVMDRGSPVTGARSTVLLEQEAGEVNGQFQSTSTHGVDGSTSGWFMDLPTGQRFVGNPRIESGVVFFPVYQPPAGDDNTCGVGGENWLYGLDSLSGAAALTNVNVGAPNGPSPDSSTGAILLEPDQSTVAGGVAPVKDVAVLTPPRLPPLDDDATADEITAALAARCTMAVQVAGAPTLHLPRPCGRQSWRQVR